MPTWSEIKNEIYQFVPSPREPGFDEVRRDYLKKLSAHTKRNTILYASGWVQKPDISGAYIILNDDDTQGFMEVQKEIVGDQLDLILHSPGGDPMVAESIVKYLRSRYNHIRVIVPHLAMSAATMIACAADEIIMGGHSALGPIDPQFALTTNTGTRLVAARDILDQFKELKAAFENHNDPRQMMAIIDLYAPDLLNKAHKAIQDSINLTEEWLLRYMKLQEPVARETSAWLAANPRVRSHGRHIMRDQLQAKGVSVTELEKDPKMQDLVLSVFHAAIIAFSEAYSTKIIENHHGRAFIKNQPQPIMPHIRQPQFLPPQ